MDSIPNKLWLWKAKYPNGEIDVLWAIRENGYWRHTIERIRPTKRKTKQINWRIIERGKHI